VIEQKFDFSEEIAEMADADEDIASELLDKRTNWDLRDRIQKLDHASVLICKLWAFRDPEVRSEKRQCAFCTRNVAVAEAASQLELSLLCLLCWFRAGRPFEAELIRMGAARA
jgi:hypothetical protein